MESKDYLAQAYYQAPWRRQTQLIVGFLLALVVVAIIAVIYLNVSARSVALGHEIQDLQQNIQGIERNIVDLETKLAFMTSRAAMEERALAMGLQPVQPEQVFYVVVPDYTGRPAASLAPPPAPTYVEAQSGAAYSESLIDWLKENIFNPVHLIAEVGQ